MASFTPGIPNNGQSLLQTRDAIKNNFTTINTTIAVDHVAMNEANQGKHDQSTYVAQGSDPTTLAGEFAVYSKVVSAITQLFGRPESNGTAYQLLGSVGTITVLQGGAAIGGGFQLRWGQYNQSGTSTAVSFNTPFPNRCYGVVFSALGGTPTVAINLLSFSGPNGINGFTSSMTSGTPNHDVFYIAIGN